jgi:protein ImuA
MIPNHSNIIAELKRQIMSLEGFKPVPNTVANVLGLDAMAEALPGGQFPLGAVHEFIIGSREDKTSSIGFISGILTHLIRQVGYAIWITPSRTIFPPALKLFGIEAEKIIFVEAVSEKEILWVTEEVLRCESVAAVVSEVRNLDFTASRRFQLAVEQSHVTGFIMRNSLRSINTTACIARWKISPASSFLDRALPGLTFPRWNVELQKIRNGKPGTWQFEWAHGRFCPVLHESENYFEVKRKVV